LRCTILTGQLLDIDIANGITKAYPGKFTTAYKDVLPVQFSFLQPNEDSKEYALVLSSKT
jgi:hypothetical protein